jgi:hypothetical protein
MAEVTTTTLNSWFIEYVQPETRKMFQEKAVLLDLLMDGRSQKNNPRAGGARITAYVAPDASNASLDEGAYLPLPGAPTDVEMRVPIRRKWKTGAVTGDVLDLQDSNTIGNLLSGTTKRMAQSFKKEINQQCYQDGSGAKGIVSAITTGAAGTATMNGDARGARQFLVGARMNFYTTAGVAHVTGASVSTVTAVNVATGVVTFDSVPTDAVVGDIVTYEGSYGRDIHGLAYHVDDATGTYQGLTNGRTTYPSLRATVTDASSGALSTSLIDVLLTKMEITSSSEVGGQMYMISHPAQQQAYRSLGYSLTRNVNASGNNKLDLGFPNVAHNGIPWKTDVDCPRDRIYFITPGGLQRFVVREPGLLNRGGQTLFMKPGTGIHADSVLFYFSFKGDIGSPQPNSLALIKALAIPSGL